MPAVPSSPIHPVLDQLVAAVDEHRVCGTDLLSALSGVPDPRARRGMRHQMTTILGLALCAVLAGARSFTAIGEWAANASPRVLSTLGSGGCPPCESTLRRTLQRLGGDDLDAAIGDWTAGRTTQPAGAGPGRENPAWGPWSQRAGTTPDGRDRPPLRSDPRAGQRGRQDQRDPDVFPAL